MVVSNETLYNTSLEIRKLISIFLQRIHTRVQTTCFTKRQKKLVSWDLASQVKRISKVTRSVMMAWKSQTNEISCPTHSSYQTTCQWVHYHSLTQGRRQINTHHHQSISRLTTLKKNLHYQLKFKKYCSDMSSQKMVEWYVLIRKCLTGRRVFFLMWPNN